MITAEVTPIRGAYQMQFCYPGKKSQTLIVKSPEEAYRILYFQNRRYIFLRLKGWLVLRNHAITPYHNQPDYSKKLEIIYQLTAQLEVFERASFHRLCAFVSRKSEKFKSTAPAESSRYYSHYKQVIEPIIQFCQEIAGRTE